MTYRIRLLAAALTLLIVLSMALILILLNAVALALPYGGKGAAAVVVAATLIANVLLVVMIYAIIAQMLAAVVDPSRKHIPSLLSGLLLIYTLILWVLLTPLLTRVGVAYGIDLLEEGWGEPESQLVRTGVIFAVVVLSWYWIAGRYWQWAPLRHLRASLDHWRDVEGEGEKD